MTRTERHRHFVETHHAHRLLVRKPASSASLAAASLEVAASLGAGIGVVRESGWQKEREMMRPDEIDRKFAKKRQKRTSRELSQHRTCKTILCRKSLSGRHSTGPRCESPLCPLCPRRPCHHSLRLRHRSRHGRSGNYRHACTCPSGSRSTGRDRCRATEPHMSRGPRTPRHHGRLCLCCGLWLRTGRGLLGRDRAHDRRNSYRATSGRSRLPHEMSGNHRLCCSGSHPPGRGNRGHRRPALGPHRHRHLHASSCSCCRNLCHWCSFCRDFSCDFMDAVRWRETRRANKGRANTGTERKEAQ